MRAPKWRSPRCRWRPGLSTDVSGAWRPGDGSSRAGRRAWWVCHMWPVPIGARNRLYDAEHRTLPATSSRCEVRAMPWPVRIGTLDRRILAGEVGIRSHRQSTGIGVRKDAGTLGAWLSRLTPNSALACYRPDTRGHTKTVCAEPRGLGSGAADPQSGFRPSPPSRSAMCPASTILSREQPGYSGAGGAIAVESPCGDSEGSPLRSDRPRGRNHFTGRRECGVCRFGPTAQEIDRPDAARPPELIQCGRLRGAAPSRDVPLVAERLCNRNVDNDGTGLIPFREQVGDRHRGDDEDRRRPH